MKKMTKSKKVEFVKLLTEELNSSTINILGNFSGLSVLEMEKFREQIREKDAKLMVAKNTLLDKVFKNLKKEELCKCLNGATFVVWTKEKDEIAIIKSLLDFRKRTGKIELKGGSLGENIADANQLETIGKLPGRKQLEAKVVMFVKMPFARISNSLKYPAIKLINIIGQIKEKGNIKQEIKE